MAASTQHPKIERKTPRDRQAADRTRRLYTREAGEGNAVLLLHAVPFNSRMWEPQLEALSAKARLIAPDLPGFGLSPAREIRSLSDYAESVVELLDDLGVEEVIVAGVSSGAYIAFDMIAPLGNRLKGLVIAGAVATPYAEQAPLDRRRLAAGIECGGPDASPAKYLPELLGWSSERDNPSLFARLQQIVSENSPAGISAALRAIADRPDFSSILPEIRCPTLCIAGVDDPLTPPRLVRDMAERIPVARAVSIAGGHLVNLEAPEAFNAELEKFFSEATSIDTPPGVGHKGLTGNESDADIHRRTE